MVAVLARRNDLKLKQEIVGEKTIFLDGTMYE
jgi:hypothetical protein